MKKLFLLSLILFSLSGYSQLQLKGEAKYIVTINGRVNFSGSSCGSNITGGLQWITAIYQDGTHKELVRGSDPYPHNGHGLRNQDLSATITYTEKNKIIRLEFRTTKRRNKTGCRSTNYASATLPISTCYNTYFDFESNGLNQPGYVTIKIVPKVILSNVTPTNNIIGSNDYLTIPAFEGIANQYIYWEYSVDNGTSWTRLSDKYQNKNSLSVLGKNILPENLHGSTLQIRVNYECKSLFSNVLDLFYKKSAPKIISQSTTSTTCFDSENGALKINFERPLDSEESLSIALKNTTTNTDNNYTNIILDNTNSYTISGLPMGNYTVDLIGFYNGHTTATEGPSYKTTFQITKPDPVDFTITKVVTVWCYGGTDGEIHFTASGGTGNYQYTINNGVWQPFSNGVQNILQNLIPGSYTIQVRDTNGCVARIQKVVDGEINLGETKVETKTITEPTTPLSISYTEVVQPTFYGGSNGKIVTKIDGGTPFDNQSYNYEWKNSAGVIQTSITTLFSNGSYYITLDQIPSDTYYLTIKDKNYNLATAKEGCTIVNSEQFLDQPEALKVVFTVLRTISCHTDNEFGNETDNNPVDGQRDESQDGLVQATVTGGVPLSPYQNAGLPYYYHWKKQLPDGSWMNWQDTDSIARYLSHGTYALNIEDKNGIRLGTYTNNILTQEKDSLIVMQQPSKLMLYFTKEDVICNIGDNGKATAHVSGGTPPYNYQWSTGTETATAENLSATNYLVYITDSKGCRIEGNILIEQPNEVIITETLSHPVCYGADDGKIELNITGGVAPYTYEWNNGTSLKDIIQLKAGTYKVIITDANNCMYFKEYTLINPAEIKIDLGEDRTLCNGQSHTLDASISDTGASYQWTSSNGFTATTPVITVTEAGTYFVEVISSLGCTATGQIIISTSSVEIDSEFFVSSQAYVDEEVVLVNISLPLGEKTEWIIPEGVEILEQEDFYTTLRFNQTGNHQIVLKQTQGDCYALYAKNIIVEQRSGLPDPGDTKDPFIKEFIVSPNSNNGIFQALIQLNENSPVHLRLFSMTGQNQIISKKATGKKNYLIDFNVYAPSGTYILILETAKKTMIKKIIII